MKIKHKLQKILLLIAYLLALYLYIRLGRGCFYRRYLQIPCPGCGMTRAMIAALRMDFAEAFRQHPMFWSVPLVGVYLLVDAPRWKKVGTVIMIGVGLGFLVNWVLKLVQTGVFC